MHIGSNTHGGGNGRFANNTNTINASGLYDSDLDGQAANVTVDITIGTKESLEVDEDNNIRDGGYAWGYVFYLTDKGRTEYNNNSNKTKAEVEEEYDLKFIEYTTTSYPSISFTHIDGKGRDRLFLQTTNEANHGVTVQGVNATAKALGIDLLDITTEDTATAGIDIVGEAIKRVSNMRSYFGAVQNRLEHAVRNTDNVVENTTAAESRIRDTDMAAEMVKYSKDSILAQAGQAMMSQANTSTESVLSLLK
ncbi:MAG: hypothetical protein K6F66_08745 [Pseudobutyrivibrio sp.]|nr:hypothetical protein [Pseudobutyrivibrio sp.]